MEVPEEADTSMDTAAMDAAFARLVPAPAPAPVPVPEVPQQPSTGAYDLFGGSTEQPPSGERLVVRKKLKFELDDDAEDPGLEESNGLGPTTTTGGTSALRHRLQAEKEETLLGSPPADATPTPTEPKKSRWWWASSAKPKSKPASPASAGALSSTPSRPALFTKVGLKRAGTQLCKLLTCAVAAVLVTLVLFQTWRVVTPPLTRLLFGDAPLKVMRHKVVEVVSLHGGLHDCAMAENECPGLSIDELRTHLADDWFYTHHTGNTFPKRYSGTRVLKRKQVPPGSAQVPSRIPFFLPFLLSYLPSFLDILPSFLDILPSFLDLLPPFLRPFVPSFLP
jgi:hypothetical protein